MKKEMFVQTILDWAKTKLRTYPWRKSNQPKEILIAEVLLQKTPADRVAMVYEEVLDVFRQDPVTIDDLLLRERFLSLGLVKRFSWLKTALLQIESEFHGTVPNNYRDLRSLCGVGDYTANAVLCFVFGKSVPMVDANVRRVVSRFFLGEADVGSRRMSEIREIAQSLVPSKNPKKYNLGLIDFGALVCKKDPICQSCALLHDCRWKTQA